MFACLNVVVSCWIIVTGLSYEFGHSCNVPFSTGTCIFAQLLTFCAFFGGFASSLCALMSYSKYISPPGSRCALSAARILGVSITITLVVVTQASGWWNILNICWLLMGAPVVSCALEFKIGLMSAIQNTLKDQVRRDNTMAEGA